MSRVLSPPFVRGCLLAGAAFGLVIVSAQPRGAPEVDVHGRAARPAHSTPALPAMFEKNDGQCDPEVRFLSRGAGHTLFVTAAGAVLQLHPQQTSNTGPEPVGSAVRMDIVGADRRARITGADPLPGRVNYLVGNDPKAWRQDVPTYGKVKCAGVYPGIDLVYYHRDQSLEYDFIVAPGRDPARIRLAFDGDARPALNAAGDIVLKTPAGDVIQHRPLAYQDVAGRRERVPCEYVLNGRGSTNPDPLRPSSLILHPSEVAFDTGAYDKTKPLIIDPVLSYSTFVGGGGSEITRAVATDAAGSAYVTGQTVSADFPLRQPAQGNSPGDDVFVAKLTPEGDDLVYATYLGGNNLDKPWDIVVTPSGVAYVTGLTDSTDFPITANAQRPDQPGTDAFVTGLSASGSSLYYSSYLGGSGLDEGRAVAYDGAERVYIAGSTNSTDYLTFNPLQGIAPAQFNAFLTRIDPTKVSTVGLQYSTYLGGSGLDLCFDLAVDAAGHAALTGETYSTDFPTRNGFQGDQPQNDAYVTMLDTSLAGSESLLHSTYLGGSNFEQGWGIALDAAGAIHVVGTTGSSDLPFRNGVQTDQPSTDAFLVRIDPELAGDPSLLYASYLGGSDYDLGLGIAVDLDGSTYVGGPTGSPDFPATAADLGPPASSRVFIVKFSPTGTDVEYSLRIGGGSFAGLAFDPSRAAYIVGDSASFLGYPTTPGAYQRESRGGFDAYVTRIAHLNAPTNLRLTVRSQNDIRVDWDDTSANETGFELQRRVLASEFVTIGKTAPNVEVFQDAGLSPNTRYTYRVRAFNPTGASDFSFPVAANTSPPPPAPPGVLRATAVSQTQIRLNWVDRAITESGFKIERSLDGSNFSQITRVPANVTTYLNGSLTANTTYHYQVRAYIEGAGDSLYSNHASAATHPNAPSAPSNLTAVPIASSVIVLAWDDNSTNESEFRIERKSGPGAFAPAGRTDSDITDYVDAGLAPATTYTYRVLAANPGGVSPFSAAANATTPSGSASPGKLSVRPEQVRFPRTAPGSASTRRITLRNVGRGALDVYVADLAAPFEVTAGRGRFRLRAGRSQRVTLRFRPAPSSAAPGGDLSAALRIASSDEQRPVVDVRVSARGE